ARLQTLELPEGSADDRPPFILVVDQYEPPPYPADVNDPGPFDGIAEKIGARAVLVFENTIDIPANDTSAYLGREDSGDGSDEGWTEANKAHADVVDWLKVRDKDAELRAANEWVERLGAEAREAREIGEDRRPGCPRLRKHHRHPRQRHQRIPRTRGQRRRQRRRLDGSKQGARRRGRLAEGPRQGRRTPSRQRMGRTTRSRSQGSARRRRPRPQPAPTRRTRRHHHLRRVLRLGRQHHRQLPLRVRTLPHP